MVLSLERLRRFVEIDISEKRNICSTNHSIYHSTPTSVNLESILESGLKITADSYKRFPSVSFSILPQSHYGRIVIATHTDSMREIGRKVYFPGHSILGKGLRMHPCSCLQEVEKGHVNNPTYKTYIDELKKAPHYQSEHIVFGEDSGYIIPHDGFGVGLIGEDIEQDRLAEELVKRNIRFKYLTIGKDVDINYVVKLGEGKVEPYTHRNFPRN